MASRMASLRYLLLAIMVLDAMQPIRTQAISLTAIDQESLPNTNFSCIGKVIGGYYADVYTGCQMFHVCTLDEKGEIHDYKFGCIMGTVFDQETRVCERSDEVDCSMSESFFYLNNDLYGPGIIPPTADASATSSVATVKVLDPSVALLAATISPPASTDTSTGSPSAPPNHSPIPSAAAPPTPPPPPPPPPSQPVPTSSPPPLVIPPGVTASSASSATRMSTSTSSSVTAAYSFPFTVSRTSTSVSASARVRIETPLSQITLNQGIDHSILPAPHLRPSLLRHAIQVQNAGQIFHDLNPTTSSPVISRTPADFEDVPRLSVHQQLFSPIQKNGGSVFSSRQKRQTTSTHGRSFRRNRIFSIPETTEGVESSVLPTPASINSPVASTGNAFRTSSRGRKIFRSPIATPGSSSIRNNPLRTTSVHIQNTQVGNTSVRQRGQVTRIRQGTNNSRLQNQEQDQTIAIQSRGRPGTSSRRQQEILSIVSQPEPSVKSQQDSPIEKVSRPQTNQPFSRGTFARSRTTSQTVTKNPVRVNLPTLRRHNVVRNEGIISEQSPADTITETVSQHDHILRNDPLPLNDPTPLPPTVLTAELLPDSVHRVFDESTAGTDFPTTTQTAFVFPETSFLCHDKVPGGLYADIETGCVVFHICSVGPDSSFNDNKFVCGEGTLFDQKSRTCQVASAVDCSRSESLYYLNDRLKGPVFLELDPQLPEQQFDFPRIQSSSSSSSLSSLPDAPSPSRFRRHAENVVDLCLSQPLGTPLADLTSGCQNYMICESLPDNIIVERHHSCKKDYLFSQMRKRCLPSKKVNCVKETLSGILGMDSSNSGIGKRRLTRSLLLHRLRRAALPPLVNVVTNAGMEDARVRRALYSLAALQRWAKENSHGTTFIEVYTLNTKEAYPKKAYSETLPLTQYGYIYRNKRDVGNITSAEQSLNGNQTKLEETFPEPAIVISSTPTIPVTLPTITIGTPGKLSSATPSKTTSLTSSTSVNPSTPKIVASLATYTVNNTGPHTTTVTLTATTVTVTNTVTIGLATTENTIVNTAIPTLPKPSDEVLEHPSTPSSTVTAVNLVSNMSTTTAKPVHSAFNVSKEIIENSTSLTHSLSPSEDTVENSTSSTLASITESSAASNTSFSQHEDVTEVSVSVTPTPIGAMVTTTTESALTSSVPLVPGNLTSTPATTTLQVETAITEATTENASTVISSNISTSTAASITKVVPPLEGINSSTTVLPSDISNNASMTATTQAPTPAVGPFTRENLPETNFTCKDKKLEQFYPDIEANCQVFHYCSPGFEDTQILDLKFLCTGPTMFDIVTQKCEDMSNVTCGEEPTPPPPLINTTVSTPLETTTSINSTELVLNVTTTPTPFDENNTLPIPDEPVHQNVTDVTHDGTVNNQTTPNIDVETTQTTSLNLPEMTTESEPLLIKSEEQPEEIDSTFTSTIESVSVEATTEINIDEVETITTDRFPREEIPSTTSNVNESYTTTEFVIEDESLITTELGPFIQEPVNIFETNSEDKNNNEPFEDISEPTTDIPGQASTTSLVPLTSIPPTSTLPTSTLPTSMPSTSTPPTSTLPLQISPSLSPIQSLNNATISSSIMNISSTEPSENTPTETSL